MQTSTQETKKVLAPELKALVEGYTSCTIRNPNGGGQCYEIFAPELAKYINKDRAKFFDLDNPFESSEVSRITGWNRECLYKIADGVPYDENTELEEFRGDPIARSKAKLTSLIQRIAKDDIDLTADVLGEAIKEIRKQLTIFQLSNIHKAFSGSIGEEDEVKVQQQEANLIQTQLKNLEATQKSLQLSEGSEQSDAFFVADSDTVQEI